MRCSSCGHENRDGAKFCGECSAPLGDRSACPACGTANPGGQKFCDSCGNTISQPGAALTPTPIPAAELPASFASERYQVQRFLGEGGKKRVFHAHDTRLHRDVAIALIKTEGLDTLGRQAARSWFPRCSRS